MKTLFKGILSLSCIFWSISSYAGGTLVTSFDVVAEKFALDPNVNIIYTSTTHDNSVAIIAVDLLSIVKTIPVGNSPAGLAVSSDSTTLYVALRGENRIAVVDLVNYSVVDFIDLPAPPYDLEISHDRLYVTPATQAVNGIMQVDLITKTVSDIFNGGVSIYTQGLLEISPDGNNLFFANKGISPASLAKFDISTSTASLLVKNPHGALGSNGQDLAITRDGNHIYYAVGGGNNIVSGYDIGQLSTDSLGGTNAFVTGPYPREITTSPDGKTAYAVHTSGHIDVWDAENHIAITDYTVSGEAKELMTDHSGDYLFAAFSGQLRVYSAEGSQPVIDSDNDGIDDAVDNCPNLYNPLQSDVDSDNIGDLCDPFPNSNNHEYAQCSLDLAACNSEVDALNRLLQDSDQDGEIDRNDKCPDTINGASTDEAGCSLSQFCSVYNGDFKSCESADWRNDEPRSSSPNDCLYTGSRKDKNAACASAF